MGLGCLENVEGGQHASQINSVVRILDCFISWNLAWGLDLDVLIKENSQPSFKSFTTQNLKKEKNSLICW